MNTSTDTTLVPNPSCEQKSLTRSFKRSEKPPMCSKLSKLGTICQMRNTSILTSLGVFN